MSQATDCSLSFHYPEPQHIFCTANHRQAVLAETKYSQIETFLHLNQEFGEEDVEIENDARLRLVLNVPHSFLESTNIGHGHERGNCSVRR